MKLTKSHIIIINTCLILSGLMILDSLNIGHNLAMFLIAGQIPGTDIYLNADLMLFSYALILGILFGRFTTSIARSLRQQMNLLHLLGLQLILVKIQLMEKLHLHEIVMLHVLLS